MLGGSTRCFGFKSTIVLYFLWLLLALSTYYVVGHDIGMNLTKVMSPDRSGDDMMLDLSQGKISFNVDNRHMIQLCFRVDDGTTCEEVNSKIRDIIQSFSATAGSRLPLDANSP